MDIDKFECLIIYPLAGKFVTLSPYSFLNNSPLRTIDPTGAAAVEINGAAAQDFFERLKNEINSKRDKKREEEEEEEEEEKNKIVRDDNGECPGGSCGKDESFNLKSHNNVKGGNVFSSLELVLEKSTEYIVGEIFDLFEWNKDYQDGTIIAASLFFSK